MIGDKINRDVRRYYEIEKELDDTSPGGPSRSDRARLKREKGRILRRAEGGDAAYEATGRVDGKRRIRSRHTRHYRTHKAISRIKALLKEQE